VDPGNGSNVVFSHSANCNRRYHPLLYRVLSLKYGLCS